ncbi:myosin heavy chain, cardiac muscle isoform-like [Heracleum sosnowskyi]|uniref:Myosin heavy chain, cardiac muscle isoform-like n=1 Tax=Heracleum sosnowskyi TaxID=360622 RepID=A0AAD8HVB7_9APIA|nr:myosin heavy chain, cardiac muscle isoform-like [Heracleum sosnowskyi]
MAAMSSSREIDPLLKDLSERKQSFRQNVVLLAAELKEVRSRLASQEQSFVRENITRQEAEMRVNDMKGEINRLLKCLDERNGQFQEAASTAEKYLKDVDDLNSKLSATQATADDNAALAQSAQHQCLFLLKEINEKNDALEEYKAQVSKLGEQLDRLQKDLQAREISQKQLKDEVLRMEHDIMHSLAQTGGSCGCELRKILDEVSPMNISNMNKLLNAKDEEIVKLRDEIRIMSTHWKLKTKDLESQLEKHQRADQELKKRVLKLEFCLQEARAQTRKLQRMGERRDKALKELRDQLATKQQAEVSGDTKKNIWEGSGFKIVVSMSMLILVVFSKR